MRGALFIVGGALAGVAFVASMALLYAVLAALEARFGQIGVVVVGFAVLGAVLGAAAHRFHLEDTAERERRS